MNGKNLKEIRKKLGITQTELANLIGRTSMRTVQNWEGGKSSIPDFVEEILNKELNKKNTPFFAKAQNPNNTEFESLSVDDKLNFLYKQNISLEIGNKNLLNENEELKEMVDNLTLMMEISLAPILRHFKLKADDVKDVKKDNSSIN